jgi:thiamine-phosphate pyrophosphorylase
LSGAHLLYVILDEETIKKAKLDIFSLTNKLSNTDIDFFQFRFKIISDRVAYQWAKELCKILHKKKKIFIINNRVDVYCLVKADGIHLGRDDLPVKEVRRFLGKKAIIGKTVHSLNELKEFQKEDVDYISIGPVFGSQLKPHLKILGEERLRNLLKWVYKPVFAIGGINLNNIHRLSKMGVKNVAICRGVILSKDLKKTVYNLKKCLEKIS